MRLFHRHQWREVRRKTVMGAMETGGRIKFGGGLWSQDASDALHGYTLIEQRCEDCGRVRIDKFQGAVPEREETHGGE